MSSVGPSTHRLKTFLESYEFYPNSVEFRIHSSKALEKWKNVQSFQLNQLMNSGFFFAPDRREILLLKYDMWSRWLYEVENLCIELGADHHSTIMEEHDMDIIISLANKTADAYFQIITEQEEYFNRDFGKIWLEVHEKAFNFLMNDLKKLQGSFTNVFTAIVDLLVEIMQYTLTEIHELNHIMTDKQDKKDNTIFLVVSPYCLRYFKETGEWLLSHRIQIYKKYFNFDSVYFKNYTDGPIPKGLISNIKQCDVEIDLEKSLFA